MAETLRRMTGLRNLLVHEYGRIDDKIVFAVIRERLSEFDSFRKTVLAYLRSRA